jgi:hypothetical protein
MWRKIMHRLLTALLVLAVAPAMAQEKEKLSSNDLETRTTLTFKVSDAALQKMLAPGWEANSPADGPSKGFNLAVVLINQTATQDPDGKPLPARTYIALAAPVKKTGTDVAGSMAIGGFTSHEGAPGAYGVHAPAKIALDRGQHTEPDGKTLIRETWEARGDDGSAIEVRVEFVRGIANRSSKMEAKVYSAAKPDFYRIYRFEQAADVVRSAATGTDRLLNLTIRAIGPKLSPLFDGSEQLISVTSIPYYSRSIYLPVM